MKREITIPITTANLIISLLRSSLKYLHKANKYVSEFETERAANYLAERVRQIVEAE